MKIFLTGATGAIGRPLLQRLLAAGHEVVATTRDARKAAGLRAAGAEAVIVDGLDAAAVMEAVVRARPEVIVHEMTSIPRALNLRRFDEQFAATNRLRTIGLENLIAAGRAARSRSIIAQSFAGWPTSSEGGPAASEEEPLETDPPKSMSRTLEAIRHLESTVAPLADTTGVVLRYGSLYGPGTSVSRDGESVAMVKKRQFPIVGAGNAVWSFVHVDDAAAATQLAIERGPGGIYNIVDDDPAAVSAWLPELARAVGAKPPRHLPDWLAQLLIGEAGMRMTTQSRGASNALAKAVLEWHPRFASWRTGFREGL